ncbi:MAG: c-type cytochrome biogenesis protein CcsB [Actinomycetota bacterium]|jgi:cytochrome c-type biogenesis protein CcsB|nr:c-type cytochrome biogenesis protein CcsB [Actinomycetota bacterium]
MTSEIIAMWTGVTLYAAATVLYVVGTVFRRDVITKWALGASVLGIGPHAVGIAIRWVRIGHGPSLGFYEVVSSYALASVLALVILTWRFPKIRNIGVIIMPVAFLLIAGAMFTPKADLALTATLSSWWLTIHVAFAKLTYTAFIASFALAVAYLVRERGGHGPLHDVLDKLPRQELLDDLSYRFIGAGFIFLGIMIVAGAIWANEAWGRYWGWDPIETWSLISWVVYAIYLHVRLTLGWRGRRAAWFAAVALPVVLFTLIGVPIAYSSIHGAYLLGY